MKSTLYLIRNFSIWILLILLGTSVNGQIIVKKQGRFFQNDTILSKIKLGDLLNTNPGSGHLYKRHNDLSRSSKVRGVASIISLAVSAYSFNAARNKTCEDFACLFPSDESLSGALFLVVGSIMGLSALSNRYKSTTELKAAIDLYNGQIIHEGYQEEETFLRLDLKSNGVGLRYTF